MKVDEKVMNLLGLQRAFSLMKQKKEISKWKEFVEKYKSIDKKIVTKETIKQFISIAYTNMRSVSTHVQDTSDKDLEKR